LWQRVMSVSLNINHCLFIYMVIDI
jgi:hypothetical protein